MPHLNLSAEQRQHLVALRAAYLVKSAMVQRQRDAAAQLLASNLPLADFVSQVSDAVLRGKLTLKTPQSIRPHATTSGSCQAFMMFSLLRTPACCTEVRGC